MRGLEKRTSHASLLQVYLAPIFVGLLLSSGLLSALLSDGLGRYFSWISIGSPLIICLWFYLQRFRSEK
jgi:hypothetical protein